MQDLSDEIFWKAKFIIILKRIWIINSDTYSEKQNSFHNSINGKLLPEDIRTNKVFRKFSQKYKKTDNN